MHRKNLYFGRGINYLLDIHDIQILFVFQGGTLITNTAFDYLTQRNKLYGDVLDFGMMQKISPSDVDVKFLRCHVYSNFNPDDSFEQSKAFVEKEMRGKNSINFFEFKALFIPIFYENHYSLAVIINPNKTLVIF